MQIQKTNLTTLIAQRCGLNRSRRRRPTVRRRLLALALSLTLILVPLLGGRTRITPPAQAQIIPVCGGAQPHRIFQGCPLGFAYETALENKALDDLISLHQLQPDERDRLLGWQRAELRGLIYGQLQATIKKAAGTRTADEQNAVNALAVRVKQKRVEAAQYAVEEYNKWKGNPCDYTPPKGFTYGGRQMCAVSRANPAAAGSIDPPKYEEFEAYGVARAYGVLQDVSVQLMVDQMVTEIIFFSGLAIGGIAGTVAAATVPIAVIKVITPFAARAIAAGGAAGAAAGAGTAAAVGGAVLMAIAAIVIGVLRGLEVSEIDALPGKLQAKLTEVQNAAPPDLAQLLTTTEGQREIFTSFLLMTLPDFPATDPVPAPQASDPKFLLRQDGAATTTQVAELRFKAGADDLQTIRANGAWLINKYKQDGVDKERWTLKIKYVNWLGESWTAGRQGANFLHVKSDDANQSFQSAEIKYLDHDGKKFTASLIVAKLEIAPLAVRVVRKSNFVPEQSTFPIALVNSGGQALDTLSILANNAESATVNNVKISNLRSDAAGRVTATIEALCLSTTPTFTLRVTDNAGQSKTLALKVLLSDYPYAYDETGNILAGALPDGNVGTAYRGVVSPLILLGVGCGGSVGPPTVTSGKLPPGLSLGSIEECTVGQCPPNQPNCVPAQICGKSDWMVYGTPATDGTYDFTIERNAPNGDNFRREYTLRIVGRSALLASGARSWWSGERGLADDLNNHHARVGGNFGNANFADGRVGLAFSFKGDNSWVRLPDNFFPFAPTSNAPFTFETWFKTASSGIIIGRQETDPWGLLPFNYSPGMYVGTDGKLRVQMFWNNTKNPVTSQAAVNDNDFHHVAVIYDGTQQIVYLDGSEMGRHTYTQAASNVSYKYQLGTGYSLGWPSASIGWFNFTGLIDEPTLYGRALTEEEVRAIYAAGSAGKIQITATAFSPTCADTLTGVILARVLGNAVPYTFGLDRNTAFGSRPLRDFQSDGVFGDLAAENYTVKIKDALGRIYTRAVTLSNSNPITFNVAPVNPTCIGASNGSLTINATGGTGALQYSINGGQSFQSANVFNNLAASTYNVIVKDASACSSNAQNATLTNPAPITAQVSGGGTIRPGQSATVNVAFTGGAAPYTVTLTNNGGARTGASPLSFTLGPLATTAYAIASATDASGCHATLSGSATITIDSTPPTITCPANQSAVIAGTTGPVTYIAPTVSDNQPGATVSCTPASGATFALGVTTVNCTARDAVGNTAACSFTVTVRQPRAAIKDLLTRLRTLPVGTLTPAQAMQLLGHLEMAITNLERGQTAQACTHLQNFVTQVNTFVTGGQLTAAQGQLLLSYTNQMRNVIGCAGSPFPT